MRAIAIYNNKGGVGKSTMALFIADFLSSGTVTVSKRVPRILVMDLDGQGSSATSLLGLHKVAEARQQKRSVAHLFADIANGKTAIDDYFLARTKGQTRSRHISLGELFVAVPERQSIINFEKQCSLASAQTLAARVSAVLRQRFDIVILDFPPNIDYRNTFALAGMFLSDIVFIPTEPSRVALVSLPDTFDTIGLIRTAARQGSHKAPQLGGIILNKTDRRTKQYRLHNNELRDLAAAHGTTVFDSHLPAAPTLSTATDDSLRFETLRQRYDAYYDHVRRVVWELANRTWPQVTVIRRPSQSAAD